MKIEESSQFLQANAVAQRVRQLIMGAAPRVKTTSRRPTAIALAELKADKLEVYDPREAAELLAETSADLGEEERAAAEAARASFEEMWAEGGDAPDGADGLDAPAESAGDDVPQASAVEPAAPVVASPDGASPDAESSDAESQDATGADTAAPDAPSTDVETDDSPAAEPAAEPAEETTG